MFRFHIACVLTAMLIAAVCASPNARGATLIEGSAEAFGSYGQVEFVRYTGRFQGETSLGAFDVPFDLGVKSRLALYRHLPQRELDVNSLRQHRIVIVKQINQDPAQHPIAPCGLRPASMPDRRAQPGSWHDHPRIRPGRPDHRNGLGYPSGKARASAGRAAVR